MAKKSAEVQSSASEIASAIRDAIESGKPLVKKTPFNRVKNTPWSPKPGEARLKLKRKMFHHGIPLGERISNEEIALLNKIRPGTYCDGFVKVTRRRDKGVDVDYPVRTASQRLRLVTQFGIRDFKELLTHIIEEQERPKPVFGEDQDD